MSATKPLACPSCALHYPLEERFCARCGMPLVYVGSEPIEAPLSDAHGRARKINPAYTEGELVRVGRGQNQAEAEMVQNLLLDEGIPSILRRSAGFDVPDYLAAGPRDVLVPQAAAEPARDLLLGAGLPAATGSAQGPPAGKLLAAITLVAGAGALLIWLLLELAH
ncbi:MAG: hypothetical protein ACJ766_06195 [Thermoleophilaceae bacterium]